MKLQYFSKPWSGRLVCKICEGITFSYDSSWVTQETIEKISLNNTIVKRDYAFPLTKLYSKNDPRILNSNKFIKYEVVGWYLNFTEA